MARSELKAFLAVLERDVDLRRRFEAAPDVETAAAVARAAGYDVLVADLVESEEGGEPEQP